MSNGHELNVEIRERAGKGAARAVRRSGRIPAVLYGDKKEPVMFSLEPRELTKAINNPGFFATVFDLKMGSEVHRGLPRDVQMHPVTDRPLHVDFLRLSKGATVAVEVACEFINEEKSPGLKRGGVLNVVRYEVELDCPVEAIPQTITVDLEGMDIGDSIHISQVALPENVTPTITDRDFTIATIAAPTVQTEAVEGEEGEIEGEGEGESED